jgi:hypothetical protein
MMAKYRVSPMYQEIDAGYPRSLGQFFYLSPEFLRSGPLTLLKLDQSALPECSTQRFVTYALAWPASPLLGKGAAFFPMLRSGIDQECARGAEQSRRIRLASGKRRASSRKARASAN